MFLRLLFAVTLIVSVTSQDSCSTYTSCSSCADTSCSWCQVPTSGSSFCGSGSSSGWCSGTVISSSGSCSALTCSSYTSCSSCAVQASCTWCKDPTFGSSYCYTLSSGTCSSSGGTPIYFQSSCPEYTIAPAAVAAAATFVGIYLFLVICLPILACCCIIGLIVWCVQRNNTIVAQPMEQPMVAQPYPGQPAPIGQPAPYRSYGPPRATMLKEKK